MGGSAYLVPSETEETKPEAPGRVPPEDRGYREGAPSTEAPSPAEDTEAPACSSDCGHDHSAPATVDAEVKPA